MGDDAELNVSLDDLISQEVSSRKRGVGKRFSRGRGRRRGKFGGGRGRGRGGRPNLRPRSRPFRGFGGRRRGGGRGGGRNNFNRRRYNNNNGGRNDEPEWRNDKYEERFQGSATSYSTRSARSSNRSRREPENFTTKSGLHVSVGSGSGNPDLRTSVQIKGLHANVQSEDLREILQKYGVVKYAYLQYNDNNESLGIGRACFAQVEHAKEAVKDLDDATIDGVAIKITYLGGGYDGEQRDRRSFTSRRGRGGRRDDSDDDMMSDDDNNDRRRGRDSKLAPETPFNPLAR